MARQKVRLIDIASEMGITANTVSKALRGARGISEAKRAEILATAERMGYVPDYTAKSLRNGASHTVAIIFDNLLNPYYMVMTNLIINDLKERGYDVVMFGDIYFRMKISDLKRVLSRNPDGIITFIEPDDETAEFLIDNSIHTVLLGRLGTSLRIDAVATDDYAGGYAIGKAFARRGAKRASYFGIPEGMECSARRLYGFRDGLRDNGVELKQENIAFPLDDNLEPVMEELIRTRHPDAVFCFNDVMAYRFYSVLKTCGLKSPDDVMLAGFDNLSRFIPFPIKLTSVSYDNANICRSAVELLIGKMKGKRDAVAFEQRAFPVNVFFGEIRPEMSQYEE